MEEIDRFCLEGPAEVELEVAAAEATLGIDLSVEVWKDRAKDMVGLAASPISIVVGRGRSRARIIVNVDIGVSACVGVRVGPSSPMELAGE